MKRFVMIGAGAIGGTIAARLAETDIPTVVVARGEHADAIERGGLLLRTPEGIIVGHPEVWRSSADAELTSDDVLVLAVKSQAAQSALEEWASVRLPDGRFAGDALPIFVTLNGVEGERLASRYFRRVFGVCVWAPCTMPSPGVVASYFYPASGVYHVSRYPASVTDADDVALLDEVAAVWRAGSLDMQVHPDSMPWKWRKLVNNVGNAFDALLDRPDHALVAAARQEAVDVMTTAGVEISPEHVEIAARQAGPAMGPIPGLAYGGSSSRQSLARGASSIEAAYLNGEIARMARELGRPAPINEAIVWIADDAARRGLGPGCYTGPELRAALGIN
ncbi:MAG: 2-dehydropantoate 2-reductase N-terminal domain-containing protein [Dermatophilus congolensis]|nr:2-dehydropantoate 2-reductase N-terminal domain-containing protein [Dermatophilus congolensis]